MSTYRTRRGSRVRYEGRRRYIAIAETIDIETGKIRSAKVVKRSDSYETIETFVRRAGQPFVHFYVAYSIIDTAGSSR